jgi:DNA recombination protein RmuC
MSIILLVATIILLLLLIGFFFYIRTGFDQLKNNQSLNLMQQQVDGLRKQVGDSLNNNTQQVNQQIAQLTTQINQQLLGITQQMQDTTGQIGQRLDTAAKVIRDVSQNLGELGKASERIFDVGKDISKLQEILRAPKLRGVWGELFLGELLGQIIPKEYFELQHRFKNGEIVDAVVFLGPRQVPIDAKFPLENFRKMLDCGTDEERKTIRKQFVRDVKKHIDDVARKYILPDEGTFDFALLYIPAENVYYETIVKDENGESIAPYALPKHVIPVSPNSLFAYLQAIVLGLRGLEIEKSAQEILNNLQRLSIDFNKFKEDFDTVGKHILNARNKYEEAEKRLGRFEDKLGSISVAPENEPKAMPEKEPQAPNDN